MTCQFCYGPVNRSRWAGDTAATCDCGRTVNAPMATSDVLVDGRFVSERDFATQAGLHAINELAFQMHHVEAHANVGAILDWSKRLLAQFER